MTKFLGSIVVKMIFFAISLAVVLLMTYVVLDVAKLYTVTVITANFSFIQFFGLLFILRWFVFPRYSYESINKNWKEKKTFSQSNKETFVVQLFQASMILLCWGIAYFGHWLFF